MTNDEAEQNVLLLVARMNERGKNIPLTVGQIRPFPVRDFGELRKGTVVGIYQVVRFSSNYESDIFDLIALRAEKTWQTLAMAIMYGAPIAGVALSLLLSWWRLLAVPLGLMGMQWLRSNYNAAILNAALDSEPVFCFLYYTKQVSVLDPARDRHFYWASPSRAPLPTAAVSRAG